MTKYDQSDWLSSIECSKVRIFVRDIENRLIIYWDYNKSDEKYKKYGILIQSKIFNF